MHLIKLFAALMLVCGSTQVYSAQDCSSAQQDQEYYVNGSIGKDSYDGSRGNPWKSIDKASEMLRPGDTVYILPLPNGKGYEEDGQISNTIKPKCNGKSKQYITYRSKICKPDKFATITNPKRMTIDNKQRKVGFYLEETEYITISRRPPEFE
jgi:hypothetical protein